MAWDRWRISFRFTRPWIRRKRIYSSNLWIGAGNNRTLLHYDAWDGFLFLAQGTKEFFMFPRSQTEKMFQS